MFFLKNIFLLLVLDGESINEHRAIEHDHNFHKNKHVDVQNLIPSKQYKKC